MLKGAELRYVEHWESEECKFAIIPKENFGVYEHNSGSYILLHKTDFDPLKRAPFRYVIDFIFVPEYERRQGIAYNMLQSVNALNLDLVAFPNSDMSENMFSRAGFQKEFSGDEYPIYVRDDVERLIGKNVKISGIQSRNELNGLDVRPTRFSYNISRYECIVNGEGLRIKPCNLKIS